MAKIEDGGLTEAQRLRNALEAFGFGGSYVGEQVGWRGTFPAPSTDAHFRCEFCQQEHIHCIEIPHSDDCPVSIARDALRAQEGAK